MIQPAIQNVEDRLVREFRGVFGPETVRRCLQDSLERWTDATVTTHIPVLAERFTRERLRASAQAEGTVSKDVPEVLFICVRNAGRSQMAAALLQHHAGGRVHVRSAGSAPADRVDPAVTKAMGEIGLDLGLAFPKPLTDEVVRAADVVITMGCGDACPVYPGKRYVDWDLPDPHGRSHEDVRRIRDEIDRRVRSFVDELSPVG